MWQVEADGRQNVSISWALLNTDKWSLHKPQEVQGSWRSPTSSLYHMVKPKTSVLWKPSGRYGELALRKNSGGRLKKKNAFGHVRSNVLTFSQLDGPMLTKTGKQPEGIQHPKFEGNLFETHRFRRMDDRMFRFHEFCWPRQAELTQTTRGTGILALYLTTAVTLVNLHWYSFIPSLCTGLPKMNLKRTRETLPHNIFTSSPQVPNFSYGVFWGKCTERQQKDLGHYNVKGTTHIPAYPLLVSWVPSSLYFALWLTIYKIFAIHLPVRQEV